MPELQDVARDLLASGAVDVVIGYETAPGVNRTRPFFARTPEDASRLVFNHAAVNNLAVYLTRAKRPAGRIAIVAKGCDERSITMLEQEAQVDRAALHVIGVACPGVVAEAGQEWGAGTVAPKCLHCQVRTPKRCDTLVGGAGEAPAGAPPAGEDRRTAQMQAVEAMTPEQRFAFWTAEFDRCIRCYACRQACPMCYCEQCIADKSMPRWIESSASSRANLSWNIIRAFHLGGRCVGCNECERACPADIPLSLLNRKLGMTALAEFGYMAGMDPDAPTLVGSYDVADREEFIK